jgi:transcriptional regulator with XRE-family HTH domain
MRKKPATLGGEIRRLRSQLGATLRGFAQRIQVSAPHLSDIEHDRRRPSKEVLERITHELRSVGATYEGLDKLDTRFDADTQEWAAETPEAKTMLRLARESGQSMADVIKQLERVLKKKQEEHE